LTKQFEEVWRGTLAEAIAHYTTHTPKGEFTVVIAGKPPETAADLTEADIQARLTELLQSGLSRSQASRQLAQETRRSKRELYQIAIELPDP
jgi:16S rRNA (cytidine1402-2'-O)-methyltransferase